MKMINFDDKRIECTYLFPFVWPRLKSFELNWPVLGILSQVDDPCVGTKWNHNKLKRGQACCLTKQDHFCQIK